MLSLLKIVFTLMILSGALACHGDSARVAVASNFIKPMGALIQEFENQTPHQIKASYGSSGKLFAQITQGAPFQVFLSADQQKPSQLIENGLGVKGTQFTYAQGQLVLAGSGLERIALQPGINNTQALITILGSPSYNKLAIANPKHAPYGISAKALLANIGLWPQIESRLVYGENIAQTYQFAMTGNAQLALIARSQVNSTTRQQEISVRSYPAILQDAVLLKSGVSNGAARAFMSFLKTKNAKEIIKAYGYHVDRV